MQVTTSEDPSTLDSSAMPEAESIARTAGLTKLPTIMPVMNAIVKIEILNPHPIGSPSRRHYRKGQAKSASARKCQSVSWSVTC